MSLSEFRFKAIEQILEVFSFAQIQTTASLINSLKREEIGFKEFGDFIDRKKILKNVQSKEAMYLRRQKETQWNKNTRRCPTCMMPLLARGIRIPKGKENIKGYTCHWYCQEENCTFEEYSYEDYQKIYIEIMGGRR